MTDYEFFETGAVLPQGSREDREEKIRRATKDAMAVFNRFFSTQDGQRVLEILEVVSWAKDYNLATPPDPYLSVQREARRQLYWWIVEMIRKGGEVQIV